MDKTVSLDNYEELKNNLETFKYKNLYCAGDGVGITRGIVQAAQCGMIVAQNILEKEGLC